jgi:acetylornithine/succinyldiaminopimelate/putrescine aminotransferase
MQPPLMNTYFDPPVTFVRGEGSWLFDADGKRYLDFLSGLAVTSLGHAHPTVADAVAEQARTLLHVSRLALQTSTGNASSKSRSPTRIVHSRSA